MPNDELKVGGYSVGGRDLMDPELTGSNVRDRETGRFSDKAPVTKIADAIRQGSSAQGGGFGAKTGAAVSSKAAAVMMQNMQPIMKQLQTLTDSNPEFADEIGKLMDLFKESHKYNAKEFSEKSKELLGQIERIKLSAGNDEQAQEIAQQLTAGIGEEVKSASSFGGIKGKVREAFNVDAGTGFKEQFKQAFSMERMFGAKGGFGAAESEARGNYEREQQAKAIGLSTGSEGIGILGGGADKVKGSVSKGSGGIFGKSGIDRETQSEKQTELLEDMLKVLEEIRDGAGGEEGGSSIVPPRLPRGPGGRAPTTAKPTIRQRLVDKVKSGGRAVKGAASSVTKAGGRAVQGAASSVTKAGLGSKALGVLGKAAVPLAVGTSLVQGYQGFKGADQLVESGEINKETGQAFTQGDERAGKTEAIAGAAGGLAGGIGGAKAGALAGAALGSFVPGVGTAIGGVVGGLVGGAAGYFGGKAIGEGLGDAATTTSGEAALEAAEESGLYDKDMIGNSEINPEILAQTTEPAQLQAIVSDDDLSDEDMNMVKAKLAELMDSQSEVRSGKRGMEIPPQGQTGTSTAKQVGGVTVEKGGEKVALTQAEIQKVEQANSAAVAMGNEGYDVSKNPMIDAPTKKSGDILAKATDASATDAPTAPIINNITNNSKGAEPGPQINTVPIQSRPASSTVQRYQDARYGG